MDLFESYKAYLTSGDKPASLATVKNYLADAQLLSRWYESTFKSELKPQLITNDVISSYIQHLKSSSASSSSSIERRVSSLRKFVTFLNKTANASITIFDNADGAKAIPDAWRIAEFATLLRSSSASDATLKNYLGDVKQFIGWFARNVSHTAAEDVPTELLSKIDDGMMSEYVDFLSLATLSPASINRKLSSLRRYLGFIGSKITVDNISPVIASRSDLSAGKQKLSAPLNEIATSSLPHPSRDAQAHDNIDSAHTLLAIGHKPYSSFAPLRMLQKMGTVATLAFDASIVAVSALALEKMQYLSWILLGKQIFSTSAKSGLGLGAKLVSSFKLPAGTETVSAGKSLFTNPIGKSGVRILSQLHPTHPGFAGLPVQHRILGHAKYTRPSWYKKYHSHSIVHYFHFAALILIMGGIGFGLYRSFVETPQKDKILAAAPTAPPRILSFQGRLTDSNDNPITSAKDLRFAIYNSDVSTGAALLWQETQYITADVDGIFSVLLGSSVTIPASVFNDNSGLYLGITVQSDSELTPRQQIATVAFAANSETLQGLYPITAGGAGTNNVVLALDSSGNLTIGGSATPTFSATGGAFTLSGTVLNLQTTSGSNSNININPDGRGLIEIQKPARNSTLNNNIPSAAGSVEIDDMFAVLATSAAQNAVTFVQAGAGPIFSASAGATTRFLLANNGTITASGYSTGVAQFNSSGVLSSSALSLSGGSVSGILPSANGGTGADLSAAVQGSLPYFSATGVMSALAPGVSGYVLTTNGGGSNPTWTNAATVGTNYWQRALGAIAPLSITDDLLIGGSATSSASFQIYGVGANAGTASSSGQLTFRGSTDPKLNVLNGEAFGIRTSAGGDAGLTERLTILNNGNVGIGTTNPATALDIDTNSNLLGLRLRGTAETTEIADMYVAANGALTLSTVGGTGSTSFIDLRPEDNDYGLIVRDGSGGSTNYANLYLNDAATDYLNITVNSANSSTGLVIASGGNVGIGSTAPANRLDVVGTARISGIATLSNYTTNGGLLYTNGSGVVAQTGAGTGSQCLLGGTTPVWGACSTGGGITGSGTTNYVTKFTGTGTVGNSSLFDNGNVGIGTTIPSSKFQVYGANTTDTTSGINIGLGGGAARTYDIGFGAYQPTYPGAFTIGLGPTSSEGVLELRGGQGTSGSHGVRLLRGTSAGFQTLAYFGDTVQLSTGGTEKVRIDTNGNLGIGTTNPSSKLYVSATGGNGAEFYGGASTSYISVSGTSGTGLFGVRGTDSFVYSGGAGVRIEGAGGALGKLLTNDISATGYATVSASLVVGYSSVTAGTGIGVFSGNVGIGTTNPNNRLQVAGGNIYASGGNIMASGNISAYGGTVNFDSGGTYNIFLDGTQLRTNNKFVVSNGVGIGYNAPTSGLIVSGNIGIGSISPAAPLDVVGDIYGSSGISLYNTAVSDDTIEAAQFCTGDGESNCVTDFSSISAGASLWQRALGALAPGNITDDVLVGGSATASAKIRLGGTTNADSFFNTGGNVGIGSTSPGYKLDVNGTGYFGGKVSINNASIGANSLDVYTASSGQIAAFQSNGAVNGNTLVAINQGNAVTGITEGLRFTGNATTRSSIAVYQSGVGSANLQALALSTGDAQSTYSVNGVSDWSVGLDNSDSDSFKISGSNTLGTSDFLTILTGGNVGIGTTAPADKLSVYGTAANLSLDRPSTSDSSRFFLKTAGAYNWGVGLRGTETAFTITEEGVATRLAILTGGNVGIGTTSPIGKLHVEGAATGRALVTFNETGGQDIFTASASGSTRFVIQNSGIVNIGSTTFPAATASMVTINPITTTRKGLSIAQASSAQTANLLDFIGASSGAPISWFDEAANLRLGASAPDQGLLNVTGAYTGKALVGLNETGNQDIFTASASGTTRFVIQNNGNVGIGSTSPAYLFDVQGGSGIVGQFSGRVIGANAVNSNEFATLGQISGGAGQYWQRANGALAPTNITDDLLIGSVASSTAKFQVFALSKDAGAILAGTASTSGDLTFTNAASDINILNGNAFSIKASPGGDAGLATRMTIAADGNVGIGTVAPTSLVSLGLGGYSTSKDIAFKQHSSTNRAAFIQYTGAGNFTGSMIFAVNSVASDSDATEVLRIANSGEVNIGGGITNPDSLLQISKSTTGENQLLTLTNTTGAISDGSRITFNSATGAQGVRSAEIASIRTGASYASKLVLRVNQGGSGSDVIDALTILSNGSVGIGTTTPVSKLNVEGATTGRALVTFNETGGQDIFTASASGTTRFVIQNNGNVGIGSTSPAYRFDVSAGSGIVGQFSGRVIGGDAVNSNEFATLGQIAGGAGQFWQRALGALSPTNITDDVLVGGSATASAIIKLPGLTNNNAFFNLGTGNLGIGSVSPVAKLDVVGSAKVSSDLEVGSQIADTSKYFQAAFNNVGSDVTYRLRNSDSTSSSSTVSLYLGATGATNSFSGTTFRYGRDGFFRMSVGTSSSFTERMTWNANNGNLGIGSTTPLGFLDIRGTTTTAQGQALVRLNQLGTADIFTASASGTTRFVIANDGNVGIGTTAPTTALDVVGAVNGSTTITAGTAFRGPVGSVGTPTYSFTGDTNTGIYSEGADMLSISTGGTQRISIGSSGQTAFGTTATAQYGLYYIGGGTAGANQSGALIRPTFSSSALTEASGVRSLVSTQATAFTAALVSAFRADSIILGAGSTITTAIGLDVLDQTVGTNNYGVRSQVTSGTNKYNIYASGNAQNYFAGNVGIGSTAPAAPLDVVGDIYGSSGISLYNTAVSDDTIEAAQFCTGDGETNCVTDFSSLVSGASYWQRALGALSPANITDDLLLGGSATASAKIKLGGTTNAISYFNTGGNVGIGSTSPGYALDVVSGDAIAGRFDGRVIGSDAVNSNEFATLGQISGGAGQYWIRANGALSPAEVSNDLLLGATATSAAKFGFINIAGGTPTATISSNFSIQVPTGGANASKINILNGGSLGIRTSVGGDAGATERLTILNGGNVGIGSTAPTRKLDVAGTGQFTDQLDLAGGATGAAPTYQLDFGSFYDNAGDPSVSHINIYGGTTGFGMSAGRFNIMTGFDVHVVRDSDKVSILTLAQSTGNATILGDLAITGGNVTTATTFDSTLTSTGVFSANNAGTNTIAGTLNLSGSTLTSTGTLAINTSNNIDVNIGNNDFFADTSTGNIGFGTTTPLEKVHIANGSLYLGPDFHDGTYGKAIRFGWEGDNDVYNSIQTTVSQGAATANGMRFYTHGGGSTDNQVLNLALSGTGNVGIGSLTPSYVFDVVSGDAIAGRFDGRVIGSDAVNSNEFATLGQISGGAGQYWQRLANALAPTNITDDVLIGGSATASAKIRLGGTTNANSFFNTGGNVAIGTIDPTALFDVAGSASISGTLAFRGTTDPKIDILNAENFGIRFSAGGTAGLNEKFTVLSSGNVGIGTTAPSARLQISKGDVGGAPSLSANTHNILTLSTSTTPQLTFGGYDTTPYAMWMQVKRSSSDGTSWPLAIQPLGGNVGIGTSVPGNLLDIGSFGTSATVSASINANTSYNTQLKFREADDTFGASIMYEGTDNQLQLRTYNGDSQGAAAFTLSRSSGNIAIGTTSTSNFKLKTAGSIGPETDDTYDLGSSSKRWRDLYLGPASLHIGTDLNEGIIGYNITDNYIGIDADGNATAESVFTDAGNLGIGTTNPATFKLEVAGSIGPTATNTYDIGSLAKQFNNTYTQNLYINGTLVNPAGLTNYWQRALGAVSPANITDDLLIGGSATTSASFQVYGVGTNAGTASSSGQISFRGTTDPKINVLNGEAFGIRTSAGGDAGLAERFTVLNNGNIGIGSSTPVYPFDMTNSTGNFIRLKHASSTTPGYIDNSSTGSIYLSSNVTGADAVTDASKPQWRLAFSQAQDTFAIQRSAAGASWTPSDLFYMASDGNIGLGTTTTSGGKIYAYGSAASNTTIATGHIDMKSNNNATPLFKIAGTGTADLVNIVDNTTEVFTILDGGNVGIGSTAPNAPLDVTGDIYVSSGISTYQTAVSNGTIEATKFCTGDGESNCTTDFSTLTNYWQLLSKVVSPANSTYDLAIGGTATSSAKFQVFGTTNGTITAGTASTSGDLTFNGTSATQNINILKGSKLNFRTASTGQGDAGLADRMTLASNGNVGIGSTTPGARLDLGFSPSVPGNARLSSYSYLGNLYSSGAFVFGYNAKANETATGNVLVANTNGSVGYQFIQIDSGGGIQFHAIAGSVTAGNVASSERMRINPNGNVGIGTTAPVAKLDLEGSTTLAQGQALFQVNQLSTGDILTASASGTTRFVLNASGNLGLNNINPRTDLAMGTDIGTFNGISIGAAANRDIRIGQDSTHNLVMSWKYNATAGNAYSVIENYGGNNMLGLQTNGGNIGIGTTTTTATLELTSTTAPDFKINSGASAAQISLNNANREWWIQADDSPDLFAIEDRTAGNLTRLAINGSGNVGIGTTTPVGLLHLDGRVTGKALVLLNETGNQDIFTASASGTPRFVIRNNGNVGIGTMLPGAPLDVVGDIYGSSGISLYNTAVSDDTIEAAQFCTGDGESNCVTDFSALTAGSSYWQRLAGNLSPATLNDTISATSGASTVATFTSNNPSGTLTNNTLINHNAAGTVTNLLNLTQSSGTVSNGITFTGTFGNLISATNFALTNVGNLDTAGTLTAGTANAFTVAATGDITTVTDETINGIDINAGAVSDVTTLTSSGSTTIGTGASSANTIGAGASSTNVIGSVTTPGALTLHGATTLDNTFTVSGSNLTSLGGNLTVTGTAWTATPTISGLITATSGLTANGALTANNTFTLGDNGDTGSINTSDWDIDITGVMTGISGITNDGVYTQTGSSQNTFTGNLDATSGLDVSGANLTVADDIYVSSGISTFATAVSNGTIEATKFCTGDLESNCVTDFAALTAGSSYWQRLAGNLSPATLNDTISATTSAAVALTLTQSGAFNALLVEDQASDTSPFIINQDGNVGIGTTTASEALHVNGNIRMNAVGGKIGSSSNIATHFIEVETSDGDINMAARGDITLNLDSDNNGAAHTFQIWKDSSDESGTQLFSVSETGDVLVSSNINTLTATTLNIGTATQTGLTLGRVGATTTINGSTLTVGPTAWTATPTISGLITATSGLTSNGTLTVSNGQTLTAAGVVTLGDGGDNFSISSNALDVSTAGVISGATGLTSSGNITFSGLTAARGVFTTTGGLLTTTAASQALVDSLSDETGSGLAVFGTSPAITTSLTTGSSSFDLLNATATTINFAGGATTALNIGPGGATGATVNVAGGSGATGCTIDGATGNLTCAGTITGSGGALTNLWQLVSKVVSPANSTYDLTVGGTATSSAAFQVFALSKDAGTITAGTASTSGDLTFRAAASSDINLLGNAVFNIKNSIGGDAGLVTRLTLAANGNLGIGTTTPIGKLHVEGAATGRALVTFNETGGQDIFTASASGTPRFVIRNSGNVGIGTILPGQLLSVAGFIEGQRFVDSSNNNFFIDPAATGVSLTTAGFSGLGTQAPVTYLHVDGATTLAQGQSLAILNQTGASDIFTASTSGTTRFLIRGSGNVGVGSSTNPLGLFSVNGLTTAAQGQALVLFNQTSTGDLFSASTSGTTRFTIKNSGNVGIGNISNPLGLLNLDGATTTAQGQALAIFNQTGTADIFSASASGSTKFVINNGGNVGIGTTAPGAKLVVSGTTSTSILLNNSGGTGFFQLQEAGTTRGYLGYGDAGSLFTNATSNSVALRSEGDLYLGTGAVIGLSLDTTGNVGIGSLGVTSSFPRAELDISGSASISGIISFRGTSTDPKIDLLNGEHLGIRTSAGGSSLSEKFTILNNGNVGVGTTAPTRTFSVVGDYAGSGDFWMSGSTTTFVQGNGGDWRITVDAGSGAGTQAFRVNDTGNVDIGATDGSTKLVVTDTISAGNSGGITINNEASNSTSTPFRIISDNGSTNNVKFRIDNDGDVFTDGSTTIGTPADVAENYPVNDNSIEAGDLVATTTDIQRVDKMDNGQVVESEDISILGRATNETSGKLIGVVSTNPGLLLSGHTNGKPVALSGRVPVKVSTINGPISAGDPLTSSPIPGVAMKATGVGMIVGRALENYTSSDINQVAKINTFVSTGWYDSTAQLAQSGNLNISGNDEQSFEAWAGGYKFESKGGFADAAIARLTAGIVKTQQLVVNGSATFLGAVQMQALNVAGAIQATSINAGSIAVSNLSIGGQALSDYILSVVSNSSLVIGGQGGIISPVADIERINTDIISPLATGEVNIDGNVKTKNLSVNGDASVSGTLRADKIIANDIEGLNARIASIAANTITASSAAITNIYNNTYLASGSAVASGGASMIASSIDTNFANIGSLSANLAYVPSLTSDFGTFSQGLMSFGATSLADTSIAGQLSVNGSLILADNTINTLGSPLEIQPLRQGALSFMGGLVAIDIDGNLSVAGNATFAKDVTVQGTLAANIISPVPNEDLILQLPGFDDGTTLATNRPGITVKNGSGSAVLKITDVGDIIASGAALASQFQVVRGAQADTSLITSVATASAGTATIKAGQLERTIQNSRVTADSLIYITATSDTSGKAPFVARQVAEDVQNNIKGSFTVRIPQAISLDAKVNWWIIN